jgi:hypothetical protein
MPTSSGQLLSPRAPHRSIAAPLDVLGSVISRLCAVHCMVMPLVAGLLPLVGLGFLGNRSFEQTACVLMTLLAFACLAHGCRRHRRWWLLALLGVGSAIVFSVQFLLTPDACTKTCCERRSWAEALWMFGGGCCFAVAHVLNLRFSRACGCCAAKAFTAGETATHVLAQRAWPRTQLRHVTRYQ